MDTPCENSNNISSENTSKTDEKIGNKAHWENVYSKYDHNELGWYEENPQASLDLIERCNLNLDSTILNVGAGATTLVDKLLELNYTDILASDISENALTILQNRISSPEYLKTIVDDLTNPTILKNMPLVDLWHDRAVLHFFIDEEDQNTYFDLLRSKIKPKGYVILAAFNLDGATKCSGLPIKQYDSSSLCQQMGDNFELIHHFDYTYTMPNGNTREYIYTLFKKR